MRRADKRRITTGEMKQRMESKASGERAAKRSKSKEKATPTASSATSGGAEAMDVENGSSGASTSKGGSKGSGKKTGHVSDEAYLMALGDQVTKDAKAIRELKGEMFTTQKFPLEHSGIKSMREMGKTYAENTRGVKDHGYGTAAPHLFLAFLDARQDEIEAALKENKYENQEAKQLHVAALECIKAYIMKVVDAKDCREEIGVFRCWEEYNGKFFILTHNLLGKSRDVFMQMLRADQQVTQLWGMAPPSANERLISQFIRNRRKR
eukprot:TRINITY_DN671_c0_g1_i3.p3 TRINITY_DN671_c0_g1~~TRINITY_DN671_c0_g1_i3.p3  ORF type:complete len:266 (-),score=92.78 TRINITY_DN671_c0_g1_i3:1469-2266(-)